VTNTQLQVSEVVRAAASGHGGAEAVPRFWVYPQSSTRNPQPSTLNPPPSTLNPQPSTLNPQPSTLNPQPSTLNPQPSTLHPQPSTLNPQPLILNPEEAVSEVVRAGQSQSCANTHESKTYSRANSYPWSPFPRGGPAGLCVRVLVSLARVLVLRDQ
jgi:hypothetical protein